MALQEQFAKNVDLFQKPNKLPVFLKGGPGDRVLFGLTVALCGLGILGTLNMAYTLGFKGK